jgi:hypothetical protein
MGSDRKNKLIYYISDLLNGLTESQLRKMWELVQNTVDRNSQISSTFGNSTAMVFDGKLSKEESNRIEIKFSKPAFEIKTKILELGLVDCYGILTWSSRLIDEDNYHITFCKRGKIDGRIDIFDKKFGIIYYDANEKFFKRIEYPTIEEVLLELTNIQQKYNQ